MNGAEYLFTSESVTEGPGRCAADDSQVKQGAL